MTKLTKEELENMFDGEQVSRDEKSLKEYLESCGHTYVEVHLDPCYYTIVSMVAEEEEGFTANQIQEIQKLNFEFSSIGIQSMRTNDNPLVSNCCMSFIHKESRDLVGKCSY